MNETFMAGEFITKMIMLLKGVLMISVLIAIQRIVFLEYNTPKQKKTTGIIIVAYILYTVVLGLMEYIFGLNILLIIFDVLSIIFCLLPSVYSSVTGRKKRSGLACLFQSR